MWKKIAGGISKIKQSFSKLEKYIPSPIKNEYKIMQDSTYKFRDKILENYTSGIRLAQMKKKTPAAKFVSGLNNVVAKTTIGKKEIPSMLALTGCVAFPYPGTMEAGYTVGRLVTSKPVMKVLNSGKNVLTNSYSKVNNLFKL